jgi:DNA-binding CsgD family transcriptional regulator
LLDKSSFCAILHTNRIVKNKYARVCYIGCVLFLFYEIQGRWKLLKTLETNDWLVMNSIIYKIYTTGDFDAMRTQFLEQIKTVIDFDSADFYLASSNEKENLERPVFLNCDEDLSDIYENMDYSRGIMFSGRSMVYRETDIISDEKRVQTEYYQRVYKPNNWHYALQMIFGRNKHFLGVVTLYRTIGKEDFTYEDVFLMDMLKDHMAYRLSQDRNNQMTSQEKLTLTQAVKTYDLTKREQTILQLLLQGMENTEICDRLSITVNTLKKHILNIYRKLGIRNRVQMFKLIKEKE